MIRLASRAPAWSVGVAIAAAAAACQLMLAYLGLGVPLAALALPVCAALGWAWGWRPAALVAALCLAWSLLPSERIGVSAQALGYSTAATVLVLAGLCAAMARWALREGRARSPRRAARVETSRAAALLVALSLALPAAVFSIVAERSFGQAFASADARTERTARIAQEHAAKVLDTNDVLIGRVEDLVRGLSDDEIRARQPALQPRLASFSAPLPQIQSVWVQDAAGKALLTDRYLPAPAGSDVSDRDYFRWHREGRGGLFVSAPGIGKVTLQPFFGTSRRRDGPDGAFAGLVSVALYPSFFARFYAELVQSEPGLAVTLFRDDGTLLARHPSQGITSMRSNPDGELMRRIRAGATQGQLSMPSSFDGELRRVSFRAVPGYPLFVGVGIPHAVVIQAWRRDLAAFAAFFLPMSAALVWAAWFSMRGAQRERRAYLQLRHETDQRIKAQKALIQTQKREALGQLTGSVTHDFNNLLAVVSNNAQLLERLKPGADPAPYLAAIRRAVGAGSQLTRQLLSISRHRAVKLADIDLREMLRASSQLLQTAVGRQVELSIEIEPDLPPVVADAAELELALVNLAVNARDAMREGGRLAIAARAVQAPQWPGETPQPGVVIQVSDSGPGIAPAVLEHVFEPFFTTKPEGHGTGLGLSQVRAACEQAGGVAKIDSSPGQGTTVSLYLPRAQAPARFEGAAPGAAADGGPLPDHLEGDLLLVEDNADLAEATATLLGSMGANVTHAPSAAAALEKLRLRGRPYDAVLSDVIMPGEMNGVALAARLRALHPTQLVVLMTGYTSELHQAQAAGFEVLHKPTATEELLRVLRPAMGPRGATREGRPAGEAGVLHGPPG